MKKIIIFTLAALSHQISCMENTKNLIQDIENTFIRTNRLLNQASYNPNAISKETRQEVQEHLSMLKRSADKLKLILGDTDGWITETSEK